MDAGEVSDEEGLGGGWVDMGGMLDSLCFCSCCMDGRYGVGGRIFGLIIRIFRAFWCHGNTAFNYFFSRCWAQPSSSLLAVQPSNSPNKTSWASTFQRSAQTIGGVRLFLSGWHAWGLARAHTTHFFHAISFHLHSH